MQYTFCSSEHEAEHNKRLYSVPYGVCLSCSAPAYPNACNHQVTKPYWDLLHEIKEKVLKFAILESQDFWFGYNYQCQICGGFAGQDPEKIPHKEDCIYLKASKVKK